MMAPPIVPAIQADRVAAASAYYAWASSNPVIPRKMLAGEADDHSMVQAFARHRIAATEVRYPDRLLIQPTRWNADLAKWQDTDDEAATRWMVMENQPIERRFLKAFESRAEAEQYRAAKSPAPFAAGGAL